jgi:hypothetical protein
MDVIQALNERRAVKAFRLEAEVPEVENPWSRLDVDEVLVQDRFG